MIKCFVADEIEIIGLGNKNKIEYKIQKKINNKNSVKNRSFEISLDKDIRDFNYIYFELHDRDSIFKSKIIPWKAPTSFNPRNEIKNNSSDISRFIDALKQEIIFKGNIKFSNHVYIPE